MKGDIVSFLGSEVHKKNTKYCERVMYIHYIYGGWYMAEKDFVELVCPITYFN